MEEYGGVIQGQVALDGKEALIFRKPDVILAPVMLLVGFSFCNLLFDSEMGLGVSLFAAILGGVSLVYLNACGVRQTRRSVLWLCIYILAAIPFSIFAGELEKMFGALFISGVYVYWLCVSTGREINCGVSIYTLGDLVNQYLIVPFSNIGCCFLGIREGVSGVKGGKNVIYIVIGIAVFLPAMAAVIFLLSSADSAFNLIMNSILGIFKETRPFLYLMEFLLGIPVACYLYGLLFGGSTGRTKGVIKEEGMNTFAEKISFAPKLTIYTALTIFNLIYVVFFAAQASYLFSAFEDKLPEAMTYAEYARRGFFELCAVAGINLAIMTVSYAFIKKEEGLAPTKALRAQTVCLCFFTLLLIATAISKMVLYIDSYGLTQLRVYTTWFMILLFFIFLTVAIRQMRKFNAARVIAAGFIALFLLLSFGNVDGMIAKYNIEGYKAGRIEQLDLWMMSRLSEGAAPYLYEFYEDGANVEEKSILLKMLGNPHEETFRSFNYQTHKAEEIRKLLVD